MKWFLIISCMLIADLAATSLPAHADYTVGLQSYRQGNYFRAFREFEADNSASAHFYLSLMYEKGDGTPQDRAAALAHLRKAAEQGLDVAQASLGFLYLDGLGVKEDRQEGLKWLSKAAAQGLPEATAALKVISRSR